VEEPRVEVAKLEVRGLVEAASFVEAGKPLATAVVSFDPELIFVSRSGFWGGWATRLGQHVKEIENLR
jgi:hypothetical protein